MQRTMEANNRQAAYDIDPVNTNRWSPRSFLSKPVEERDLLGILEAARWAPSAFNDQPWRFIVARSEEDRQKFYSFISEFNLVWCKSAPVLIMIVSQSVTERGDSRSHAFDTGASWGLMSLEAARKGLSTHAMTGFDFAKAREVLNVPEGYELQALIAIGYRGPKEQLPESLREREQPSPRRAIEESLFEGGFQQPLKKV
jgi:nitroreductase